MKNFILFVTSLVSGITMGQQNTTAANNYTETFSNYRAELGSGNFVYNVPLFNIETMNPDFNFQGNLFYNAQAASSIYTAKGIMDTGWSADFLPSIYREIKKSGTFWDESYYKVNTAEVYTDHLPFDKPERTNDLFHINVFGIKASFRLKYHNNNATLDIIDSNTYIEVIPDCTVSLGNGDSKIINISGFTVKDGNGYTYSFNTPEESEIRQNYVTLSHPPFVDLRHSALANPNGYNVYKRAFLLTNVADKYGRDLLQYHYKSYVNTIPTATTPFTYNQKVIDYINVVNKAKLVFIASLSKINSIAINNQQNQLLQKINLSSTAVTFYNQNDVQDKSYVFAYYPKTGVTSAVNIYGNYLKTGACIDQDKPSWVFDDKIQHYSAGLLRSVTLPHKGKINVEYETNTYTFVNQGELMNELNYEYSEVPVTYNASNDTYSFSYGTLTPGSTEGYYLKFNSTVYTDPFLLDGNGNPLRVYPGLQIHFNSSSSFIYQGFDYENQCAFGERINGNPDSFNPIVVLHRNGGNNPSYISNVKVYKKTKKAEGQRINYNFGPSVRVKKITNNDHTGTLLNEKIYSYMDPTDSKRSSGIVWNYQWYYHSDDLHPIFYRYITEEESGKGKTVYQMNMDTSLVQAIAKEKDFHTKNIWKYNETGQLIEQVSNEFEYYKLSDDEDAEERIKKINSVINMYEGASYKTTSTEKVFDTISKLPVYSKIVESGSGDTFNEQYTHQKLGNAFYQTKVEKTKNNAALNQSTFTYQPGTSQAYNLKTVSVAKEARPLEVEKEITLIGDYGNIREYKTKEGMVVSQIWGYNDSKLVAELKNVSAAVLYSSAYLTVRNNIANYSNQAGSGYSEANLTIALNSLRASFPDGFVTTYTYKPLLGITSITDVNGRKETYQYDSFNRLWRVLNHEGLITKEYYYHIKN